MIPIELELHGFSRAYATSTITLDFDLLGEGVFAWCGPNGAGKSTAMGGITAALYGMFPGYDYAAINHVAKGVRDAFASYTWRNRAGTWRARILCDPAFSGGRGKTERYLDQWAGEGWRAHCGPSVKETAAELAHLVPALPFWLSGPMASQGGAGGFWKLSMLERKAVLVELLGHGLLRTRALQASDLAKTAAGEEEQVLRGLSKVQELEERRAVLEERRVPLVEAVEERRAALRAFEAQRLELEEVLERGREELVARQATVRWRETAARLELELATIDDQVEELNARHAPGAEADEAVDLAQRRWLEATDAYQVGWDAAQSAERNIGGARVAVDQATFHLEATERRAGLYRAHAEGIAGVDLSLELCQRCPLTASAQEAARDLEEITPAIERLKEELATRRAAVQRCDDLHQAARAAMPELTAARETAREELEAARQAVAVRAELLRQRSGLVARRAALLAEAEAHLRERPVEVEGDLEELEARVADAELARKRQAAQGAALLEAAREAERDLVAVDGELAQCTGNLEGNLRAADLETMARRLGRRHRGARLLAMSLGPNGAQALELAQAAPRVTDLANEFLRVAYGERFQLRLETLRPYKRKEGVEEVFECVLLDAENQGSAHEGSPGEMVIAEEALRLALCIYSTAEAGVECRTLFRDEAAGALDQWPGTDAAARYLAMLRAARTAATPNFHQVHFIAHQPALYESADGRFIFERGSVRYHQEG